MRAALLCLTLLHSALVIAPVRAEPRWPHPNPAYVFAPSPGCERARPAALYDPCVDQMALFEQARAQAAATGKRVLVVFGAAWCPSCKGLKSALPDSLSTSGLAERVVVVEVAISTLVQGKVVPVPSGEAVRANLMMARPQFRQKAIPFFAVVDPVTGRTSARNMDDLDHAGTWSRRGIAREIGYAETEARGGAAAPAEPRWLVRKWRRWFGD